jgi:hypothetical protein
MKKTITIGFSKSKKKFAIGSFLIRLYQMTPFSHCYIRMNVPLVPSDAIIHASEGKVLRMSGTQFDKRHEVVKEFCLELDESVHNQIRIDMHEISGDDYSIWQNAGIILVDIARILGFRIANPWVSGWNCSEFVVRILRDHYPTEFTRIDPETVTPKELYVIIEKLQKGCPN